MQVNPRLTALSRDGDLKVRLETEAYEQCRM